MSGFGPRRTLGLCALTPSLDAHSPGVQGGLPGMQSARAPTGGAGELPSKPSVAGPPRTGQWVSGSLCPIGLNRTSMASWPLCSCAYKLRSPRPSCARPSQTHGLGGPWAPWASQPGRGTLGLAVTIQGDITWLGMVEGPRGPAPCLHWSRQAGGWRVKR